MVAQHNRCPLETVVAFVGDFFEKPDNETLGMELLRKIQNSWKTKRHRLLAGNFSNVSVLT